MQVNIIYGMCKSEVLNLYIQIYLFIIFEIGTETKIHIIHSLPWSAPMEGRNCVKNNNIIQLQEKPF